MVQEIVGVVLPNSYKRTKINTTDILRSLKTVNLSGPFSMTCWCKVNELGSLNIGSANGIITNHDHGANNGAGITLKTISVDDCRISCNTGDGTGRTYNSYYGTTNIFNKWAHLVLSYDGTKIRLYVNGLKEFETNTYYKMSCKDDYIDLFNWSTSFVAHGIYRPAANLQDVRIYDHCLSDKEIYDLAKAKVLHYDFEDVEEPTVNEFITCNLANKLEAGSFINTGRKFLNYDVYETNGITRFGNHTGVDVGTIYQNQTYTLTAWVRITVNPTNSQDVRFSIVDRYTKYTELNSDYTVKKEFSGGTNCHQIIDSSWRLISLTVYHDNNSNYHFADIGIDVAGSKMEIAGLQLEKKDHVTPFVNGTRDNILVRDKSDYGNDSLPLTVATTPAFVEDCKIGRQGADFSKAFGKTIVIDNFVKPKSFTVCTWAKINAGVFAEQPGSVGHNIYTNNDGFCFFSELACWVKNSDGRQVLPFNGAQYGVWGHYCFTYDETTGILNTYLNGNLCGTRTLTNNIVVYGGAINSISISLSSYPTNGLMDDLRIYATALTAEDIKEIYQSRANLDDKGNLNVINIVENESTSFSLSEKGVLTINNISEIGVTEGLIHKLIV